MKQRLTHIENIFYSNSEFHFIVTLMQEAKKTASARAAAKSKAKELENMKKPLEFFPN